jgi:hypothetical protein
LEPKDKGSRILQNNCSKFTTQDRYPCLWNQKIKAAGYSKTTAVNSLHRIDILAFGTKRILKATQSLPICRKLLVF